MNFFKYSVVAVALVAFPARADCMANCSRNTMSCSQRCHTNSKCYRTCEEQSDACISGCQARGEANTPDSVTRGKCVGPKGKLVQCSDLAKTVTPAQIAKGQANAKKEQDEKSDKNKKPTPEQMTQMRELGIIP